MSMFACGNQTIRLRVELDNLKNKSLFELFNMAATISGAEISNSTAFDCREIIVSKTISDMIFEYYRANGYENLDIAAIWLQYGPKVDNNLDPDCILISEFFVR